MNWKTIGFVAWGVLTFVLIFLLVLFVPKRIEYSQKIDKIDNLIWQYQIASVNYEREEVEDELFRIYALSYEKSIMNTRNHYGWEDPEANKRIEELKKMEEFYLNNIEWNVVRLEAAKSVYERILNQLDSLGVPKETLEDMNNDMDLRIINSLNYYKDHLGFMDGWKDTNLYTMEELWITKDRYGNICIFLDEPQLQKKSIWDSDRMTWGYVRNSWDPNLVSGERRHYKLVEE